MASQLPMIDVYLPMMKAAAIISAGQLHLFEALSNGPLQIPALASATESSETGVRRLVDFLVAVGYLIEDEQGISNAPQTERWFTSKGDVDYSAGLRWTGESWSLMSRLADSVRRGAPVTTLWESMEAQPSWGPMFSNYMHAFARHLTADLEQHVTFPTGARRLLDLGGSHGIHTAAFCRRHPELHATIVDFSAALTNTRALLEKEGVADRVTLVPGDLTASDWGTGYDAMLVLSVAHNQTPEVNQRLFLKAGTVLRPGGALVIHEYLTGQPRDVYDAAFRLTLLTETATRTYSEAEYAGWLDAAGFVDRRRIDLEPREKGSLLVTRRAS